MISKEENSRLKEVLGNHYTSLVLAELKKRGVVNKNNKPHTANQVRVVFNGGREHEKIEEAIYSAAETVIATKLLKKAKREKILKSA
ncbi:hypothetical protein [Algibacter sp. PT7-4]|uniref:hypothetical protein n=1 Tax=Algibacter ulvanivorans TaxID=3400999 RepID=UPI003AAA4AFA